MTEINGEVNQSDVHKQPLTDAQMIQNVDSLFGKMAQAYPEIRLQKDIYNERSTPYTIDVALASDPSRSEVFTWQQEVRDRLQSQFGAMDSEEIYARIVGNVPSPEEPPTHLQFAIPTTEEQREIINTCLAQLLSTEVNLQHLPASERETIATDFIRNILGPRVGWLDVDFPYTRKRERGGETAMIADLDPKFGVLTDKYSTYCVRYELRHRYRDAQQQQAYAANLAEALLTPGMREKRAIVSEVPADQWEDITEYPLDQTLRTVLSQGEVRDYGPVTGKYLTAGDADGPMTITKIGVIGQSNSQRAAELSGNHVMDFLKKQTVKSVHRLTDPPGGQPTVLVAFESANPTQFRHTGDLTAERQDEVPDTLFLAITATDIAGEMDLWLFGQDPGIKKGSFNSYNWRKEKEVIDGKHPTWPEQDGLYGRERYRLLSPEQRRTKEPLEIPSSPFMQAGMGVDTDFTYHATSNEQMLSDAVPENPSSSFLPLIQKLRREKYPYARHSLSYVPPAFPW